MLETGALRCPRCCAVVQVPEGGKRGAPRWWKVALASLVASVLGIFVVPVALLLLLLVLSGGGGGGGGLGAAFALIGIVYLGAAAGFLSGLLIPWFWYASILWLGPRRCCGLWLGGVAGIFMAIGFIGLSPFLAGDYVLNQNKLLFFLGTVGCLALGGSVGLAVARWPGSRMLAGVAGGFLAGILLAGALVGLAVQSAMGELDRRQGRANVNLQPLSAAGSLGQMPAMADIAPFVIYSLSTLTMIGAVLGMMSRRDWRVRPFSDSVRVLSALPVLLLWGPLLGFLCQRVERAMEPKQAEVPKSATAEANKWLDMIMEYNLALQFTYQHWHSLRNSITKQVGEAGSLFSDSPNGISASIAWPAARRFEVTVYFDLKATSEKLNVRVLQSGFQHVEITLDGARVGLRTEVPPGEHRLVIRGSCPEPDLRGPALPARPASRPSPASERP
jgi:hypothetical protein